MSTTDKRSVSLDVEIGKENLPAVAYFTITPAREEIKHGPNAAPYEEVEVDFDQIMIATHQRIYDILDIIGDNEYDRLWQLCYTAVKEGKV